MHIPKKIEIAGRTLDVDFVKKMVDTWGAADFEEDKIFLVNVNKQADKIHFLHECIHWMMHISGITLTTPIEEQIADALSELFYQLLPQIEGNTSKERKI